MFETIDPAPHKPARLAVYSNLFLAPAWMLSSMKYLIRHGAWHILPFFLVTDLVVAILVIYLFLAARTTKDMDRRDRATWAMLRLLFICFFAEWLLILLTIHFPGA